MPMLGPLHIDKGNQMSLSHPASVFIRKQQDLMKKGYTEEKAFEMVEKDISAVLNKQRDETRILRGVALDSNAASYMGRF